MFLTVRIVDKSDNGRDLEPIRINMSKVVDYRRWRGDGGKEQTVFFFDKTAGKNKTIADIPVGTVDDVLGTKKLKEYEELVG